MTRKEKDWGYEIWFANNELYCGKIIVCRNRIWSSGGKYHYHLVKDETFLVIEGTLVLDVEGKIEMLDKNDKSYRIRPGIKHRFKSLGKQCKFIEVSTTHREEDSIRVEKKE